ncbi:MAG: YraN family protein, partial [Patescibacteria group bacterium]
TKGYKLLAAGWEGANCEIDLVMKDGDCIVFVEVKTRRTRNSGYPEESVTPVKKAHIARGAEAWTDENRYSGPWRADVVAISLLEGEEPEIVHFVGI